MAVRDPDGGEASFVCALIGVGALAIAGIAAPFYVLGPLVPAVATGHDSAYAFKCRGGKPVVDGTTWTLDKRGFARKIWTVLTRH